MMDHGRRARPYAGSAQKCHRRRGVNRARQGDGRHSDRGMVTVEIAMGLLIVTGMAVVLGWVGSLVVVQTQLSDTAAQVARFEARGDAAGVATARNAAPEGTRVDVRREGRMVVVTAR